MKKQAVQKQLKRKKVAPLPYPVEALPGVIRDAVLEMTAGTIAPMPIVVASALTAVSAVVHGLADVTTVSGSSCPISLFFVTVDQAEDKKVICDASFTYPVKAFQKNLEPEYETALKTYQSKMAVWCVQKKVLVSTIRSLAKCRAESTEDQITGQEAGLQEHLKAMPEKPVHPQRLYFNVPGESLAFVLDDSMPAVGVINSNANTLFGFRPMLATKILPHLKILNRLWDGQFCLVERHGKIFFMDGLRLVLGLHVHPEILSALGKTRNAFLKSTVQAFLRRSLVSLPDSMPEERIFRGLPEKTPKLEAFHERLKLLLGEKLPIRNDGRQPKPQLRPPVMGFTPRAAGLFRKYNRQVTEQSRETGSEGGAFMVANAARLAATFEIFERGTGDIQPECMERGMQVADWYQHEARRVGYL